MFFCFYAYDMENLIISEMQFLVDDETYRLKHETSDCNRKNYRMEW